MGLTIPGAETPSSQQSANLAHQLQLIKDLLSAPITALVDDSSNIKDIFEQIESQLPEPLQIKLWPASNLPFFRVEVNKARQRIEARRSQTSLKADIAQKCKALNQKKATLDIKADVSTNMNRGNSSRPRKLPLQTPNKKPRKYPSRYKQSLQRSAP